MMIIKKGEEGLVTGNDNGGKGTRIGSDEGLVVGGKGRDVGGVKLEGC